MRPLCRGALLLAMMNAVATAVLVTHPLAPPETAPLLMLSDLPQQQLEEADRTPPPELFSGKNLPAAAGAAAVGLVVGALVPVVGGFVTATTAAIATGLATTRDDELGSLSRRLGLATADAAKSAYELERRYQVRHKVTHFATETVERVRRANSDYEILRTFRGVADDAVASAKRFDERYGLLDKTKQGLATTASVARQVNDDYQLTAKLRAAALGSGNWWTALQKKYSHDA